MSGFQPAVRTATKARVACYGVGGSGKTTFALTLARVLAGADGKIAVLDAEGGSSAKYADEFRFDMRIATAPFHPMRFAEAVAEAAANGYSVFVGDGITPFWSGEGGVQAIVDSNPGRWAVGSPAHAKLIGAILNAPIHVVVTIRAKGDTIVETDANGKVKRMQKVGLKPDTREGIEYEVDALVALEHGDNTMVMEKTRIRGQLGLRLPAERMLEWCEGYAAWCESGAPGVTAHVQPPVAPASPASDMSATPAPPPAPAPAAAAPPPAAAPTPAASADPTGGLGPAPAQAPSQATGPTGAGGAAGPGDGAATVSEARLAIRERIKAATAAILPHDPEIGSKVAAKIPDWFGGLAREADLFDAQADELATRLEATLQRYQATAVGQ